MATSKAQQKLVEQKLKEGQQFFFSKPPDLRQATTSFAEVTRLAPNASRAFSGSPWLCFSSRSSPRPSPCFVAPLPSTRLTHVCTFHSALRWSALGRLDEAVASFRDGLALMPHYGEADSRMMLAEVLKRLAAWRRRLPSGRLSRSCSRCILPMMRRLKMRRESYRLMDEWSKHALQQADACFSARCGRRFACAPPAQIGVQIWASRFDAELVER